VRKCQRFWIYWNSQVIILKERDSITQLGLSEQAIKELKRSMDVNLVLMIRRDEKFDLEEVLVFFNKLFKKR